MAELPKDEPLLSSAFFIQAVQQESMPLIKLTAMFEIAI
jgi:hypothetical protein